MCKSLSLSLLVTFLLCGCSHGDGKASGRGDVLLVMGDSLSAGYGLPDPDDGWVTHMEQKMRTDGFLEQDQAIVNASVSGETSAGGLERLPDLLEEHHPQVVVIELGANDALRRQPMSALDANLTRMVGMSRKAGARVVLVGMDLPGVASFLGGAKLEDTIAGVGDKMDIPVVDFPMADLMGDGLMQEDRLHPTSQGQPVIQKNLEPVIRKALQGP